MELKRAIKKIPSEQNLRVLSSLIISLANKVDSTSEKCINPFTPNTAYAKGSYVTHDNYIYESKLACNDADWVESHWVRLSDTIEELTVNDVKSYLSLTQDQLDTLSKIILDSEVRLDKTWSSSRVYSSIQDAIDTSKAYTLAELGKASGASYRVVASTGDMTDQKYIYLMSNGSGSYDLYIVEDNGSAVRIGDTSVNLDNYYTKTEIEADFLKKTDAASTYATITTVDGKIDKTSILSATSSTATDEQVYSAKAINTELDKKVNKTDITTTINSTSTDDTVPSTKAVYNTTSKFLKTYTSIEQLGLTNGSETIEDIANSMEGFTRLIAVIERPNISIYPHYNGTLIVEKLNPYRVHFKFCIDELPVVYVGTYHTISGFSGWKRLCATSVADVPSTQVNYNVSDIKGGRITYEVINGVCYVNIIALVPARVALSIEINQTSMPKPRTGLVTCSINNDATNERVGLFYVETAFNNCPRVHFYSTKTGYATFSYPVAES